MSLPGPDQHSIEHCYSCPLGQTIEARALAPPILGSVIGADQADGCHRQTTVFPHRSGKHNRREQLYIIFD